MLQHHILSSLRWLKRHLTFSAINVFGFGISLACCLAIGLYLNTELSYDRFHLKKYRIYRYIPRSNEDGSVAMQTWTPTGLGALLHFSFMKEVEAVCRLSWQSEKPSFKDGERDLEFDDAMFLADSTFFNVFSFKLLQGDSRNTLNRPATMAISQKMANQYFPNESPIGKTIQYNNLDLEITGVFENVPTSSHLKFSCLVSLLTLEQLGSQANPLNNFSSWNYLTYILTAPGVNIQELQKRITDAFYASYTKSSTRPVNDIDDWLQPLREIYFTKGIKGDVKTGNLQALYLISSLGVIILLVACFNFINLSTALALRRAKEIGVRKTMGALRKQLISQYLSETFLQLVTATLIAVVLLYLSIPLLRHFVNVTITVPSLLQFMAVLLSVLIITVLLAGFYPALYISSFNPAKVLKSMAHSTSKSTLRRSLSVFQFTTSIVLLTFSVLVYNQLNYLLNKDLGYNTDQIVTFFATSEIKQNFESFRSSVLDNSSIQQVSLSNNRLGRLQSFWRYKVPESNSDTWDAITTLIIDDSHLGLMNIELKEGRKLSSTQASDKLGCLVNETFVNQYGLENPIGHPVMFNTDSVRTGVIVGVVKDFYFQPLHNSVSPIILRMDDRNAWLISAKLNNRESGLKVLEEQWKKFANNTPFYYQFLDDYIDQNYQSEKYSATFTIVLTCFSVLISLLGLFGLTLFSIAQRAKEIGIRKVLGSSVTQIVTLFSTDAIKLILVSFLMAAPLTWLLGTQWLRSFAYKIQLNIWYVLSAGVVVTILGLLVVAYQAAKAGKTNPVDAIRTD